MAQLPSQSVTWVTLSWIHSSLYPRTFSFSMSGATPSHSRIRPGSLWITWIFCGVLLGAESREQNTITLCRKIKHYPYWKWLKRQFHPLSLYQPEERKLLQATSTMFTSSAEDKVSQCLFARPQESQRANRTYAQHAEAHGWISLCITHHCC